MKGVPKGFRVIGHAGSWIGLAVFATRHAPPTYFVKARGYVGPWLLEQDREYLEEFARIHPEGFDCVIDARDVVLANPLNVIWVRWIKSLPAVRRYVVVATSPFLRALITMASPIVSPDAIEERVPLPPRPRARRQPRGARARRRVSRSRPRGGAARSRASR